MTTVVTADRGGYNFLERAQQRSPGSILGQMLTVKQAAQYLGITTATLQRRIKSGSGPTHYKFGNRMLFKRDDVMSYKSAGRQPHRRRCEVIRNSAAPQRNPCQELGPGGRRIE